MTGKYHASINNTAMCENTEAIKNRQNLGIYYFLEQAARMDVFIFSVSLGIRAGLHGGRL